jgi:hypothetical protein
MPDNPRKQAERLQNEMEEARGLLEKAHAIASPYEAAFWEAHRALEAAINAPTDKATRLRAYDLRMHAGHAWHPHRSRQQEMTRWLKAIRAELTEVNKAIGG